MSNYYAPCFYRIHFVGIPSYIELPWINAAPLNVYVILHYHLYFVKMFFRMFYFSEYGIGMFLFVFWLRNRPSIKYVHNWGTGGRSLKICTGTYKKRGRAYHRDLFDKLNFSEYDIRMFLFVFWLKNRPSIKYVRKWGKGGGHQKWVQIRTGGEVAHTTEIYLINYFTSIFTELVLYYCFCCYYCYYC